ncbi:MAG: STAS/SEC14 domain-containing protein [Devosia nanyangense]|uniref:STAS/SEC14 domain-containing protein n=1 Tax=Devosia nanyangense TaxID=1228055 RepID=A0A933NYE5_9HYPH|nr:STAS/SEC14 domain-containing protein [Devosia nanyangense]
MENEQTSRVASIWVGDDGIARIIHVPGAEVTLEDARETMAAYKKLNNGKRLPLFIDTKTMKSLSRDARHFYASDEAAACASAAAIIVGTPVSRVLGNFYLGLSNPHLPTRLFSEEGEALAWLQGFAA